MKTLTEDKFTHSERKVLAALRASSPQTIKQLRGACFPGVRSKPGTYGVVGTKPSGTAAAYRKVANAMRRLVAGGFVEQAGRGTYAAVGK